MKVLSNRKLQEQIQWTPHEKQSKVLDCDSQEIVVTAGRGFGKTQLMSYIALKSILKGEDVLLVAPTYELCDRVLENIDKWLRLGFPPLTKAVSMRPPQSIDFRKVKDPNIPLGRLEARSAESPEGMLGKRFDTTIVDEAARISRDVWETYIFPTSQVKGGRQYYISTPRGKDMFYELWLNAKETGGAFRFESRESPYFTDEDWEKSKKRLPEAVFSQEYKAEFLSDATAVFKGVDKVMKDNVLRDATDGHRYIVGLDLGRKNDYTVITVIDTYDNCVVYWDRFNKIDWNLQRQKVEATAIRYNHALIVIDANNMGDAMVEELERDGMFVEPFQLPGGRSQKKKELIEKLAVYIENEDIILPRIEVLKDELSAFGWEFTPSKRIRYQARTGHDDSVMSLAYAVSALQGPAHPISPIKQEIQKNRRVVNSNKFI